LTSALSLSLSNPKVKRPLALDDASPFLDLLDAVADRIGLLVRSHGAVDARLAAIID
jgi:hypothetical protein